MIGYEPHALSTVLPETSIPTIETCLKSLNATGDEALTAYKLVCQVMSFRNCQGFKSFEKGDKVWLEAKNLKCSIANLKFATKREGPFMIIIVLSLVTYQLHLSKTWKIHLVFHASLLSPYHENSIHGLNFPAPPPDLIKEEEEYEIEKILCHHGTLMACMFLIQWKGYSAEEDSWISEWDLKHAKFALNNYKRLHSSTFFLASSSC